MDKIDLKKTLKHLYSPSAKEISVVDVPKMNFLMLDGEGNPNNAQTYREAVEALFAVSYAAKFIIKKETTAVDYTVMPLEGLWWADDMTLFSLENKDIWKWTAMIMQPEYVTHERFEEAKKQVVKKKDLPALQHLRLESFCEGQSAQILYIGSYADEGSTIKAIHHFIENQGYKLNGKHHEIYISDPNKTAPDKLKTIIRQPFA
jgi:hypothetical protein